MLNPSKWPDEDLGRLKADLDDREKAINVRRAQKMEKVCQFFLVLSLLRLMGLVLPTMVWIALGRGKCSDLSLENAAKDELTVY